MSEVFDITNKRQFINALAGGKKLVNHHEDGTKNLINPLLHSEDENAKDMILLPVAPKFSRVC
jgi:predicted phage-related endonuclease